MATAPHSKSTPLNFIAEDGEIRRLGLTFKFLFKKSKRDWLMAEDGEVIDGRNQS